MQDLLQLMYQDGHLSSTELAALRRTSRQLGENPVRVLRSLNVATPSEIKELLQRYYGFAAATDKVIDELDDSLRALIPADIALHYCVIPIAEENNELYVLMEDPTDKGVISQLSFFLDKKIVPVIATVLQLSNGLCRLYGVEPGRLRLSGLLEASRGAVGISSTLNIAQAHFVDDSQPLLDDEVFNRLKAKPKKKKAIPVPSPAEEAPKKVVPPPVVEDVQPKKASDASETSAAPAAPAAPSAAPAKASPPSDDIHDTPAVEPELVAALNVLGLGLSLAGSRSEAVAMSNQRLSEFAFTLELLGPSKALMVWKGMSREIELDAAASIQSAPAPFRTLLKKIAQCRAE